MMMRQITLGNTVAQHQLKINRILYRSRQMQRLFLVWVQLRL